MADAVIEGRQGEDSVATVEAELAATEGQADSIEEIVGCSRRRQRLISFNSTNLRGQGSALTSYFIKKYRRTKMAEITAKLVKIA